MTTQRRGSAVRTVLLACLVLALCDQQVIPDLTLLKRTYAAKTNETSSSEESKETDAIADAATTASADAARDNDANSEEDDDAFGGDDENGSDDDILSNNNVNPSSSSSSSNSQTPVNVPAPASGTSNPGTSGSQSQIQDASSLKDASAGDHVNVQAAHSTWQVTLMTVIMCSLVGMVLLLVVGAWYKDLGFRSFRPGKPEHMLLEDDEHSVYHRTTQPEPRQVGTYAPLT